jgi:hypothetical protein
MAHKQPPVRCTRPTRSSVAPSELAVLWQRLGESIERKDGDSRVLELPAGVSFLRTRRMRHCLYGIATNDLPTSSSRSEIIIAAIFGSERNSVPVI